jgi:tRNA pseudouridine55 synthase
VTSHDVVEEVRRLTGRPAGHAGTLDPAATGVLVVAVGAARKLLPWLKFEPKRYRGTARVGVATDTGDAAGRPTAVSRPPWPSFADWERAALFVGGKRLERPPAVSARKVAGRPAYAWVRRGESVWLQPRPVERLALAVEAVDGPVWRFSATVTTGTYVRALVRDWAEVLGHAAHLQALVRTGVGPFDLADAQPVPRDVRDLHWISWRAVWEHPVVEVAGRAARGVRHGRWPSGLAVFSRGPVALAEGGQLLAVADGRRLLRVFTQEGDG